MGVIGPVVQQQASAAHRPPALPNQGGAQAAPLLPNLSCHPHLLDTLRQVIPQRQPGVGVRGRVTGELSRQLIGKKRPRCDTTSP